MYYLPVGSGLTAPKTDGIIQRIKIKTISMFAGNINEVRLWKFKAGKLEMCKDFLIVLRQSLSYDFQEYNFCFFLRVKSFQVVLLIHKKPMEACSLFLFLLTALFEQLPTLSPVIEKQERASSSATKWRKVWISDNLTRFKFFLMT